MALVTSRTQANISDARRAAAFKRHRRFWNSILTIAERVHRERIVHVELLMRAVQAADELNRDAGDVIEAVFDSLQWPRDRQAFGPIAERLRAISASQRQGGELLDR